MNSVSGLTKMPFIREIRLIVLQSNDFSQCNIVFILCREILTLLDGGEVALDWAEKDCSATSPIVIILPGLTGGSQSEYIKCLVSAAKKVGIRCVIFNNRGLGGMKLKVEFIHHLFVILSMT